MSRYQKDGTPIHRINGSDYVVAWVAGGLLGYFVLRRISDDRLFKAYGVELRPRMSLEEMTS
jgi:hypothetical protein